jgi:uncharacterized BrkB/YihY/UPF0761 family membrane protein
MDEPGPRPEPEQGSTAGPDQPSPAVEAASTDESASRHLRERADRVRHRAEDYHRSALDRWPVVRLGTELVRRWLRLNASVFAGFLAYRLFLLIVPLVVLIVAGLGYASDEGIDLQDQGKQMRLSQSLASTISSTANEARGSRLQLLVVGLFAVVLAALGLLKALRVVFALAWGVPVVKKRGWALLPRFLGALLVLVAVLVLRQRIASNLVTETASDLVFGAFNIVLVLGLSLLMPHKEGPWHGLLPGSVVGGVGFGILHIAAIVYFPNKLASSEALYGTLGIVIVVLAYLFLVAEILVLSAVVNTVWHDRHEIMFGEGREVPAGTGLLARVLGYGAPLAAATDTGDRERPSSSDPRGKLLDTGPASPPADEERGGEPSSATG